MSQWNERVDASGVTSNHQELGNMLLQASERPDLTNADMEALDRLKAVHGYMGTVLEIVDPYLIAQGTLDQVNKALTACSQHLSSFVSDGNVSHLINANAYADQLLPQLAVMSTPRPIEGAEGLRDSATSFRRSASQLVRHLEEEVEEVAAAAEGSKQKLDELSKELAEQRKQVTQVISDLQGQFLQAQETRLNDAAEAARQRGEEFSKAQSERQEEFQVFVQGREEVLDDELQARKEQLSAIEKSIEDARTSFQQSVREGLEALNEKVTVTVTSTEERSKKILDEIQQYKEQAERLLGVIGEMGITSGYQKVANRASKVTWFWHGLTIAGMGLIIFIAYEAFLPLVRGNFTWESFAGRVFLTLTVAALAAYAAHQADKNSRIEHENRRIELDLASIGPYLAEMPEEKQEEFRMILADRIFGRQEISRHFKEDKSPASAMELLKSKELREFADDLLATAIKAAKH